MNVKLLNPFILASGEVLAKDVGIQAKRGQLSLQRETHIGQEVTVLISLVGDIWGVVIIGMSFDTAKALVSRMLGEEVPGFNELAQSGISELGNVITGMASTKLAAMEYKADISVPTLIVGGGSRISTFDIDRLIVPLETELGTISLTLALRESKGTPATTTRHGEGGLAVQLSMPMSKRQNSGG